MPIPSFHDGLLEGIVARDGEAHIFIRAVDGLEYTVILRGVRRLIANHFMEGNIILDVVICRGGAINKADLRTLYEVPDGTESGFEWFENIVKDAIGEELTLVEVVPTYGCELLALCDAVEVRQV